MSLTQARLRELLYYELVTGEFFWICRQGRPAGSRAGTVSPRGYVNIGVDGRFYRGHRLAWLYVTGEWPTSDIDHKNNVRSDNRIDNLRLATVTQNKANQRRRVDSTNGFKGVTFAKHANLWRARIRADKQSLHLGYFHSLEAAHAAYCEAAQRIHGEFARFA